MGGSGLCQQICIASGDQLAADTQIMSTAFPLINKWNIHIYIYIKEWRKIRGERRESRGDIAENMEKIQGASGSITSGFWWRPNSVSSLESPFPAESESWKAGIFIFSTQPPPTQTLHPPASTHYHLGRPIPDLANRLPWKCGKLAEKLPWPLNRSRNSSQLLGTLKV